MPLIVIDLVKTCDVYVSVLCSSVPPEQLALTILRHPVPSSNMLVCAWNLHCEPYASCRNWHLYSNVFVRSTKYWSTWVVVTGRFLFSLLFSWVKRYYFPKLWMTVKLATVARLSRGWCMTTFRPRWPWWALIPWPRLRRSCRLRRCLGTPWWTTWSVWQCHSQSPRTKSFDRLCRSQPHGGLAFWWLQQVPHSGSRTLRIRSIRYPPAAD